MASLCTTTLGEEKWLTYAKEYIDYAIANYPTEYTGYEVAFQKGRIGVRLAIIHLVINQVCAVGAVLYDILGYDTMVDSLVQEVNSIFDQTKAGDYFDWESGLSGIVYAGDYLNNYFGQEVVSSDKIVKVLHLIYELGSFILNTTNGALNV